MEAKKIVQISFVILLVITFVALIYGVFAAVSPESFLSRSFPLYTGQPWNDFLTQSPTLANYMIILEREAGGLGIALSLGGVIVLLTAFRKVEKWAWYYILVVSIIGWVNLLIANIIFKNSLIIVIIGIGLLLVVVGLIMSARVFLTNKKE